MKTIASIISLPITLTIEILCFLFVLMFESDFTTKDGVTAFSRIKIESKNLFLVEMWEDIYPIVKIIISCIIYNLMFF